MRIISVLLLSASFALVGGCQKKSGYAHCVSVQNERAYTGEWLKNSGADIDSVMKTEECAALEKADGESDGAKAGRIRWAECLVGPDCDESGKF